MVREYYSSDVTRLSEGELSSVFQAVEPPACLLGGWAVHLHVNEGFEEATGRGYVGSRDIDVGFHVDPTWDEETFRDSPIGRSLAQVEALGYARATLGLVQTFDRETGDPIAEDAVQSVPSHRRFDVRIDVIPDTEELTGFADVFGFHPPGEPLLGHAFEGRAAESLADYVDWDLPNEVLLADSALLGAMKVRSVPLRNKEDKRVKDIADLHALLWYVEDFREMVAAVQSFATAADVRAMFEHLDEEVYADAAELLGVDEPTLRRSIEELG